VGTAEEAGAKPTGVIEANRQKRARGLVKHGMIACAGSMSVAKKTC